MLKRLFVLLTEEERARAERWVRAGAIPESGD
jgi:hypothetical protein